MHARGYGALRPYVVPTTLDELDGPTDGVVTLPRWTKTFTEPRVCAAIVDRLTYGGNIIETGTESYRLAQTRARAEATAPHQTVAG